MYKTSIGKILSQIELDDIILVTIHNSRCGIYTIFLVSPKEPTEFKGRMEYVNDNGTLSEGFVVGKGEMIYLKEDDVYLIQSVFVLKKYRNRGYCHKIIQSLLGYNCGKPVLLETFNPIAKHIYEKFGFRTMHSLRNFYELRGSESNTSTNNLIGVQQ